MNRDFPAADAMKNQAERFVETAYGSRKIEQDDIPFLFPICFELSLPLISFL
jgi:hypothetical protein